ncbi:hypothetical protein GPL21_01435 [Bradyrhizobium pachyrhizi]|uniref:Uncharacterized protein n=2 Tax=Nitrobacteraceae TaxID=41294 RepID=A0A844SDM2_9BRAD|nr:MULTISPECIES: hypothetical protein [Bradyrhizobium]MVT63777.1 hypothetical protein [Bradyrhizobium pachyrhizi]WFU57927.1 hypothetical protein QA639_10680 [Bradyrhizobium pachyrhizi]WOH83479.1 hypothetical protein RX327_10235 [Bradyrhizobium sp. BEA-2-5]
MEAHMTRTTNDLRDQADRAERLARTGIDSLTVERLRAYAEECRIAAAERERQSGASPPA